MKQIILYLSLLFLQIPVFSQNSETDSLENLLANHKQSDTVKINLLNQIAKKSLNTDLNKAHRFALEADSLSRIIGYKKGQATSMQIIGNYCIYIEKFEQALQHYQQALELSQEIDDKNGIAYSYNFTGNVYLMRGDYPKAMELYKTALTFFIDIDDKIGISGIYNNLANISYMQGDYPRTLEYFQNALKVFEELDNKIGMSGMYNNLGVIYDAQRNYTKALEFYEKALEIRLELNDKYGISDTYTNIGNIYDAQKNYTKALDYFQKAHNINLEINHQTGKAISLYNIGAIHLALNNYKEAIDYFRQSTTIAEQIGSKDIITGNNIKFCHAYFKLKNYKLAIQYGEKGYHSAVEQGERDNIQQAAEILAQCYAASGNFQKAYQYHIEFKTQSDSLFNESNIEKITNLENQYAFEKEKEAIAAEQAKKDTLQAEELKRQKIVRNSFIAGFVLMIALALLIFKNLTQKRRANQLLAQQKHEIEQQAEELRTANDKLRELDEFKQGLTGMIVHDLKNPLNSIIHVSDTETPQNQIIKTKQAGKQMLNMVLNILDVQKYEDNRMTVDKTPARLYELAQHAINDVAFLATRKNITIQNTIAQNTAVKADTEITERIFVNLLTNAIKYTPNNGKITLQAENDVKYPNFTKISVTDTGEGIPTDKLQLVFAKFGQVAAKKSGDVRSTGLGLTFCKMAVEAHGGKIGVESEIDKGTTFWFVMETAEISAHENLSIAETKSTKIDYQLTLAEKQLLIPFAEQLKNIEIYRMFDILKILKNIDETHSENITKWKQDLINATSAGNTQKYNELVSL